MLMNYHIGRLVLSSLCVGAFVAVGIWWCSFCRLQPAKRTPQIVRSVPEAATTVLCTPDGGRDGRPKHVE